MEKTGIDREIDLENKEFQDAWKLISFTSRSIFLTGKAGTGKSTFLRYITGNTGKRHVVLAPTGIAAVNVGGQTIHSFFKMPFKPLLPDDPDMSAKVLRKRLKYNNPHIKLIRQLELIVIDEVSMVRADTIDFIDKVLRIYSGNMRQPFGGKQLLLVGDIFQLEPVVTGDMRDVLKRVYDQPYFFNAKVFRELSIVPIELRKVYRQTDQYFISMLDRIRLGTPLPGDIDLLNSKVDPSAADATKNKMAMTIATRRDMVDHINEDHLNRLKTSRHTFTGKISGEFPESSLPTDLELILKEGAQVVFIKNDFDKRWVNGTIGKIIEIGDDKIVVELQNGDIHAVEREKWGNIRYEYDENKKTVKEIEIGSFIQFPLKLAWALTIHKSQGLTFDNVIIDMGRGAFSGGQSYVALSRCTSIDGITLISTLNERDIFVNPSIMDFSRMFNDERLIGRALDEAKADGCYRDAAESFDKGDISRAVDAFADAVIARNELGDPVVRRLIKSKLSIIDTLHDKISGLQKQLDENISKFRKLATEYVEMGEECREDGWDLSAAIANYDKAISIAPDYAQAWVAKGLALSMANELDNAMDCFRKAHQLDCDDYRAPLEAGRLLLCRGDIAGAMEQLMISLDINDKIPAIHDSLAEGYGKVGDKKMALRHKKIADRLRKCRSPHEK